MTLELGIPGDWLITTLSEVSEIIMGQSPLSSDVNEKSDGLVFFQGKAEFGKLHPTPRKYCTVPKKIAVENDILLSVRAPVGPTNLANQETAIGRGLAAIRTIEGCNYEFLYYYMKYIEPWLSQQGTGTTFPAISGKFLKDVPVILAPQIEQKEIIFQLKGLLQQVDNLKSRIDAIPNIIKQFRESVLSDATNGVLTKKWRSENNEGDWEYKRLGDLDIAIQIGPFGSLLHKSDYIENGVPVINPTHINNGVITASNSVTISAKKAQELKLYELQKNDIVLGRRGKMGRSALVRNNGFICGTGSLYLRPNLRKYDPEFISFLLSTSRSIEYMESVSVGTTMTNLNQKVLKNMLIPCVSLVEQKKISETINEYFSFADNLESRVNSIQSKVNSLTPYILEKVFQGELTKDWRQNNPDLVNGENSANELLSLIRDRQKELKKKNTKVKRRAKRMKITEETVKEIIANMPEDFTFEELRKKTSGEYELLKSVVFSLLTMKPAFIEQFFDEKLQMIRFKRLKQ